MIRPVIILLLCLSLFILSACGGGNAPAATTVPPTDAPAEATAESADNAELPAEGVTATVSFPSTSARSGPATSFDAVQQVSVNQVFPVIAQTGEGSSTWYLVDLGEGVLGWLWARVVTISPADAVIEPAATVPAP
ncbi:MAG: SH3 domain-containing protein [bacterium]|nr:SH3 domain-containing protein [bacterium]